MSIDWIGSALAEAKAVAVESLGSDYDIFDFVPESVAPPCAFFSMRDPMVEPGETFGDSIVNLNLTVCPRNGTNDVMTAELLASVSAVVSDFMAEGMDAGDIRAPYMLTINQAKYLASDVPVSVLARPLAH